jgi:hypothetical protein
MPDQEDHFKWRYRARKTLFSRYYCLMYPKTEGATFGGRPGPGLIRHSR